ncbi:hypothetical protein ACQP1W_38515 [Spirillospora sp. CA-255316]
MNATVAQQPRLLGRMAVQSAVGAAEGERLGATSMVPVKMATRANAAEFATS